MSDRRERFRTYMDNFDAAADPRKALRRGFYVAPPPRGGKSPIALRAELEPACSQLVVGGIGTGKTTELLVAEQEIEKIGDTYARYVDVSVRHDLRKMDDAFGGALTPWTPTSSLTPPAPPSREHLAV